MQNNSRSEIGRSAKNIHNLVEFFDQVVDGKSTNIEWFGNDGKKDNKDVEKRYGWAYQLHQKIDKISQAFSSEYQDQMKILLQTINDVIQQLNHSGEYESQLLKESALLRNNAASKTKKLLSADMPIFFTRIKSTNAGFIPKQSQQNQLLQSRALELLFVLEVAVEKVTAVKEQLTQPNAGALKTLVVACEIHLKNYIDLLSKHLFGSIFPEFIQKVDMDYEQLTALVKLEAILWGNYQLIQKLLGNQNFLVETYKRYCDEKEVNAKKEIVSVLSSILSELDTACKKTTDVNLIEEVKGITERLESAKSKLRLASDINDAELIKVCEDPSISLWQASIRKNTNANYFPQSSEEVTQLFADLEKMTDFAVIDCETAMQTNLHAEFRDAYHRNSDKIVKFLTELMSDKQDTTLSFLGINTNQRKYLHCVNLLLDTSTHIHGFIATLSKFNLKTNYTRDAALQLLMVLKMQLEILDSFLFVKKDESVSSSLIEAVVQLECNSEFKFDPSVIADLKNGIHLIDQFIQYAMDAIQVLTKPKNADETQIVKKYGGSSDNTE